MQHRANLSRYPPTFTMQYDSSKRPELCTKRHCVTTDSFPHVLRTHPVRISSHTLISCIMLLLRYYYYLLRLSCHSVAVVLTLVQTKQIRINIHKRNKTKTQYKQFKTQYIQVYILPKHSHNFQNTPTYTHSHIHKLKQPHYKIQNKWNSHNTIKHPQYKVTPKYVVLLSPRTSP